MLGRGIDQILPHPSVPRIFESYVKDARDYILLAEQMNGKILYPVPFDYIWGDALGIWRQEKPDIKIINLETAKSVRE
jgi:poly-gamma-glutamate capsule biosynthesis protein CapA/YwtB (metallophosphatase superfamily)